ncbi:acyltransferase family protein [Rhizobium sp. F40D2]|uniref:acyltransferase family protein n=1 Tax=Rhizobium sp. F40D2 TaxID=3453141 RepID=UPI003F28D015
MGQEQQRLLYLDGLRGIAAATVLVCHAVVSFDFAMITGNPKISHFAFDGWLHKLPFMIHIYAGLPVCIFFVLSGLVLSRSAEMGSSTVPALILKRYLRLMPVIVATSLIVWFLYRIFGEIQREALPVTKSVASVITFANGIPSFTTAMHEAIYQALLGTFSYDTTLNVALWTMRQEFQGSVLIYLVAWMGSIWGLKSPASRITMCILHLLVLVLWSRTYISLFSAGALLGMMRNQELSGRLASVLIFSGLLIGTLPNGLIADWPIPPMPAIPFTTLPHGSSSFYRGIGAVILIAGLMHQRRVQGLLSDRFPQFLGRISFALYLIHFPILLTVGSWIVLSMTGLGIPYGVTALVAFFATTCITTLIAIVISKTVDHWSIALSGSVAKKLDLAIRKLLGSSFPPQQKLIQPGQALRSR